MMAKRWFYVLALAVVILDQFTKCWMEQLLVSGETLVITGFFKLVLA